MNFSRNLPNQRVAERDEEIIEKNDGSIERKTRSKANQIKTVDQWTVAACRFAVTIQTQFKCLNNSGARQDLLKTQRTPRESRIGSILLHGPKLVTTPTS
jgi:hypothetical protein